jgi:hypothetical protein
VAYYRFEVLGGEFVIQGERHWQLTFNGIQIGGLYRCPEDALCAIERVRCAKLAGPNLAGIPDPPADLAEWHSAQMV